MNQDVNKSKLKNLKKILEEDPSNNQAVIRRSLIHRHHGKGMLIIENQGPENISRFYVCENCGNTEIPYLANLLRLDKANFYSNFSHILNRAS